MNLNSAYDIKNINYTVENFKSLADIEINLKPMTLLFGANGSGKSTLIKSILFLKHYLNRVYIVDQMFNPYWYLNVHALSGSEIDLVSFSDTVTNNDVDKEIKIGFQIEAQKSESQKEIEDLENEFNEIYPTAESQNSSDSRNGLAIPKHLGFEVSFYFRNSKLESYLLNRIKIVDKIDEVSISYFPYLTTGQESDYPHLDIEVSGRKEYLEDLKILFNKINEAPLFGDFSLRRDNSRIYTMISRIVEQRTEINQDNVDKYYEILEKFIIHIPSLIMDILQSSYVPSIRQLPEKSFLLNNERFTITDYYGIARLLDENDNFKQNINALIKNHFHKTEQIIVKKESLAGQIILRNTRSKSQVNLVNSSSGFLQLLPIMSNLIESKYFVNSMFLCEQPELHLHPKLQTKLVDLFVDTQFRKNQKIIETHSEHIVRKLQVLIAQGRVNKDSVAIYYFDKDDKTGSTSIKEMELEDDGFFKDPWPDGFFDDSYNLAKELIYSRKN